jgi:signal transduction histidine kinase
MGEDIEVVLEAEGEVIVDAYLGQIEQVLMNLAVNARDAMPQGGRLTIRTDVVDIDETSPEKTPYGRPGRFVCLTVQDNGIGMADDSEKHIFEPFYTTKETGMGSGLGLSVAYGIIEQHAGWINVASELGQGTKFQIYPIALQRRDPPG